ncbi:MAG: type II secretion system protein GspD [Anaerolineae bacterium]
MALSTGNFPATNPMTGAVPSNAFSNALSAINATTTPMAAAIPFTSGFDLGVIGDIIMHKGKSFISLGSLVNALEVDNDSTILLNPKVIAQDNNNATMFVGQNIPFVGSFVTTNQTSVTQSANVEYRDVGLNLSITPILGNGNTVTLAIQNDISAVTQNLSSNNASLPLNGLQTTHSSLNTTVQVPDKHFFVLNGIVRDTKARFRSAIPCLGGLPVIGLLFSENDRTDSKDNLIIFVCPHIINSFDDYRQITEHQQDLYKEQAVIPILKEEFDAAVDVVKPPESD